jgi:hypothetical protein
MIDEERSQIVLAVVMDNLGPYPFVISFIEVGEPEYVVVHEYNIQFFQKLFRGRESVKIGDSIFFDLEHTSDSVSIYFSREDA